MGGGTVKVAYPKEWCVHLRSSYVFSLARVAVYSKQPPTFERQVSLCACVRALRSSTYLDGWDCIVERPSKSEVKGKERLYGPSVIAQCRSLNCITRVWPPIT